MKTIKNLTIKKSWYLVLGLFFSLFFFSNSINAQITVKGIVKGAATDGTEVLNGANIYLENKKVATTSNRKGEFTFPQKLKIGDVLVFSYLGFVKKKVKIDAKSTFLTIILEEDDNQMLGALNDNKPFKSKRLKPN